MEQIKNILFDFINFFIVYNINMGRPKIYTEDEIKKRKYAYQKKYQKKRYEEDDEFREKIKKRILLKYVKNNNPVGRPKKKN